MDVDAIVEGIFSKNKRALARAITYVENDYPEGKEILKRIYPKTGSAHVIGITGFPGVGKSTIVSKLTQEFRTRGKTVGIVAVDPGSPFTGGALLGDRLRMDGLDTNRQLWVDPGVFFRSMSSRGRAGGLSAKTGDVIRLMDAFGFDVIFVETVGAGQSEVDIIEVADTSIVALMPEMGDDIQINKAGILEIGDIYVVNKADLGGAEKTERWIKAMLMMDQEAVEILSKTTHADEALVQSGQIYEKIRRSEWIPPVIKTVAEKGEGIDQLADAIEDHFDYLKKSGRLIETRKKRLSREMVEILVNEIRNYLEKDSKVKFDELVEKVSKNDLDPHTAIENLLEEILK
ncbi:LAO/AO transport system ATPase [Archaeoglobus sulfaticallidus PM70-1]|uniref:LAO/AO transport system ATPase n=1 Tax=Archaeoglobus sulfaticallidus PM70-1 TaxID=387631 RepID=N0BHA2_9EURY|nr:methylmalonyl Co-A mutase-associated GTPase MeaB [Archaeoglobus sulfaticallidus]AGK61687.1 LAO/AO transport system ATPase [Archaeoglobus sulfaticallidus PM70-1]